MVGVTRFVSVVDCPATDRRYESFRCIDVSGTMIWRRVQSDRVCMWDTVTKTGVQGFSQGPKKRIKT